MMTIKMDKDISDAFISGVSEHIPPGCKCAGSTTYSSTSCVRELLHLASSGTLQRFAATNQKHNNEETIQIMFRREM